MIALTCSLRDSSCEGGLCMTSRRHVRSTWSGALLLHSKPYLCSTETSSTVFCSNPELSSPILLHNAFSLHPGSGSAPKQGLAHVWQLHYLPAHRQQGPRYSSRNGCSLGLLGFRRWSSVRASNCIAGILAKPLRTDTVGSQTF